jgi:hypothetical protein
MLIRYRVESAAVLFRELVEGVVVE